MKLTQGQIQFRKYYGDTLPIKVNKYYKVTGSSFYRNGKKLINYVNIDKKTKEPNQIEYSPFFEDGIREIRSMPIKWGYY